ncbi:hypothetical protein [Sediminibacterium sp.]|uniref:hypothetical protein n=1 Tax=Sediminibacterium sp. TaxID=1917865 RepID=UPI002728F444|nr:hypothetical protein [Sediminibacterium sp.]MDO9000292.1 hypothetical protein [Bacteroidota bacterium]MDP3147139.1 hypothetical protein [Bacteroidota bacterium]MDP3567331.1 hypothetical protein [Sediminibacterium sp.]
MAAEKSIFITEEEKIELRLKSTHKERFHLLMQLIKASQKIKKAQKIKTNQ